MPAPKAKKRFEFEHEYKPYTDYTSVRDDDPVRRVTIVEESGKEPWAYLTMQEPENEPEQRAISVAEATALLAEEVD